MTRTSAAKRPQGYALGVRPQAVIYLRISSDPTGLEAGVRRQEKECRELCEKLGFDVAAVFKDNDKSATNGKVRPEFERLLKSNPEMIVVWHIDRLCRVSRDLERVLDLNVDVHSVTSGHVDLSHPAGRATARTVTAWATYETEQKALRQKAGHRQRAVEGRPFWTRRPFGFERDGTVIEHEALIIRSCYARLLAGVNLRQICDELNTGLTLSVNGNPWLRSSLRQLLMSARNAGIMVHLGEEVGPGAWDPIVPVEIFRAAYRLLDDPSRKVGGKTGRVPQNLLSAWATCGECEGRITVGYHSQHVQVHRRRQYMCRGNFCCMHDQELSDKLVAGLLIKRLSNPKTLAQWTQIASDSDVTALRNEQAAIQDRLDQLAVDYADGTLTKDQVRAASHRLQEKLNAVDAALDKALSGSVLDGLTTADSVEEWWNALSLGRQRAVLKGLNVQIRFFSRGKGSQSFDPKKINVDWAAKSAA